MFLLRAVRAVLLDDDPDLLDALAEMLASSGCTCLVARSLDELIKLGPAVLEADVAVLDINLGPDRASGIEAYDWLLSQGFTGRILFLTGHARSHPLVARARTIRNATVLEKPMGADALLDQIVGTP